MKNIILTNLFIFISILSFAQKATLKGTIQDAETQKVQILELSVMLKATIPSNSKKVNILWFILMWDTLQWKKI
jgi:hypothetical protein